MKRFGLLIFAILLLCVAKTHLVHFVHPGGPAAVAKSAVDTGVDPGITDIPQEHFSPNENLESFDIAEIEKAHSFIDIAMYAFTDRALAEALLHTDPHVQIRLYRDGEQFESEQQHATYGRPSTTQMLAGRTRIHIRVKRGDPREYMHCKEVLVDGMALRDGSANWSRSALEFQDNSWFLITNPPDILRFRRHFEQMWNRPSNLVIQ